MRGLTAASVLAALVLAMNTVGTAQAAAGDRSRAGFCAEGEGMAVVLDFRGAPREQWPGDNTAGYEVRCLSGPGLSTLDLTGSGGTQYAGIPGRANMSDGSFDLTNDFSATGGTISRGWSTQRNTPWVSMDNVDKFVGFTYSPTRPAEPGLNPQFAQQGAAGPDQSPTPRAPSTGSGTTPDPVGGGTPDRVDGPERAGDPERSDDPADPDARAPGGEAGSEEAKETPEPTESPESDEALTDRSQSESQSQELGSTDSLTGGPTWLWVTVVGLVVAVYLAVTWLVLRARKAARLAAGS